MSAQLAEGPAPTAAVTLPPPAREKGVTTLVGKKVLKKRINPLLEIPAYEDLLALAKRHGASYGQVIEALLEELKGEETFLTAKRARIQEMPFFGLDPSA